LERNICYANLIKVWRLAKEEEDKFSYFFIKERIQLWLMIGLGKRE